MLVLPIVNKNRIMNVQIRLRNANKIRRGVCFDDAKESEIIVNREKFSESSYKESKEEKAPTDFIRSRSLLYPRNILVTTREENDSTNYDVYEVPQPPKKVNDSLDCLYGKAITDLRKEIPRTTKRGRYVSFEDLGIGECLTDDKIAQLQRIVKDERDTSKWPILFEEAGISELPDTIHFLNNFECTLLSDYSIPETSLQDTLKSLEIIHSRDFRNLSRYYQMAKSNSDIYRKMSYVHQLIYSRPLTLIQPSKKSQKILVKKKNDENEFRQAA